MSGGAEAALRSTEFLCETWGSGEFSIRRYAPLVREPNGRRWVCPMLARDWSWAEVTDRATRIWAIQGSFWNPQAPRLIYQRATGLAPSSRAAYGAEQESACDAFGAVEEGA